MSFPFRAVTFDCFGTLIDWQSGQATALETLPALKAFTHRIPKLIQARGPLEIRLEQGPWRPYQEILAQSITEACKQVCEIDLPLEEAKQFAQSQEHWPAFPDTVAALQRLSEVTAIGLLSNCDTDVLLRTARTKLQAPISLYISSEKTQTYKPNYKHWHSALNELQCEPTDILHVSFTRHYDLNPAHELGFQLGFLSRYNTPVPDGLPISWQAKDLAELVKALGKL